ncbi:MAG TPA: IS110 family transposase [Microbacteriaceae bacterium]|nr:IS110 family transposase [Microbacteriaceae bacterium]
MVLGIDSHKATLACSLVDDVGRERAARTFANTRDGHRALLAWARRHADGEPLEIGVESAFSFARVLVDGLLDLEVVVFDVPPKLVDRSRRRRGLGKSDVIDAREIARTVLREHERLTALTQTPQVVRDIKLLVEHHAQLARERTKIANRVHADLIALLPGYQAAVPGLDTQRGRSAARELVEGLDESIHRTLAIARLARVVELDRELRAAQRLIATTLDESGTGLRDLRGIGVLIAARLIAEVRDVRRFPTADAFARVNGTAPIPASSGQTHHHRLNRGGNRRLNHALHMMALVQARTDPRAKAYIAKHRAAGKSYRDSIRALKRRLSDVVWRQLQADLALNAVSAPAPLRVPRVALAPGAWRAASSTADKRG